MPDVNVSYRDERWEYFLADTLPVNLSLLDRQGQVEDVTAQSLEEPIAEERILHRLPEIPRETGSSFPNRYPVVR